MTKKSNEETKLCYVFSKAKAIELREAYKKFLNNNIIH